MAIAEEVRAVIRTHVSALQDVAQYGRLVETADIVQLVHLAGYESTSAKQLHQYVSFRLREEAHVCRYAVGAHRAQRFLHIPAECTPSCKTIDVHAQQPGNHAPPKQVTKQHPIPTRLCTNCYITVPAGAECGFCE